MLTSSSGRAVDQGQRLPGELRIEPSTGPSNRPRIPGRRDPAAPHLRRPDLALSLSQGYQLLITNARFSVFLRSREPLDRMPLPPDASATLLSPQRSPRAVLISLWQDWRQLVSKRKELPPPQYGHRRGPSSPHIPNNLDLLFAASIYFMQTGYSLYTLRQATGALGGLASGRRLWSDTWATTRRCRCPA